MNKLPHFEKPSRCVKSKREHEIGTDYKNKTNKNVALDLFLRQLLCLVHGPRCGVQSCLTFC